VCPAICADDSANDVTDSLYVELMSTADDDHTTLRTVVEDGSSADEGGVRNGARSASVEDRFHLLPATVVDVNGLHRCVGRFWQASQVDFSHEAKVSGSLW